MSYLRPILSGDVLRILLFLKAIRYGRHEEILPEFLLTVKNLSFAPGGPNWCVDASGGPYVHGGIHLCTILRHTALQVGPNPTSLLPGAISLAEIIPRPF